jgi:hypothetical protein
VLERDDHALGLPVAAPPPQLFRQSAQVELVPVDVAHEPCIGSLGLQLRNPCVKIWIEPMVIA